MESITISLLDQDDEVALIERQLAKINKILEGYDACIDIDTFVDELYCNGHSVEIQVNGLSHDDRQQIFAILNERVSCMLKIEHPDVSSYEL